MNQIAAKVSALPVKNLKEMANLLSNDFSTEAGIVLDAVIIELQAKLPADEFIAFCGELEAA